MNDGKKTTRRTGEIQKQGKAHSTRNGKIISGRSKASEGGKQKRDRFAEKIINGIEKKKSLDQIEIPFPASHREDVGDAGTVGIVERGEGAG